ncbi:MAG: S49 family peptidase [Tannerella sp.]|jgi:protease-4|nr:S49 family peptidase [Tannerella sp.]
MRMFNRLFLFEIFTSRLLIRDTSLSVVEQLLLASLEGDRKEVDAKTVKKAFSFLPDPDSPNVNPYDGLEKNSVAVIPVNGMMTKYSYWWMPGCDELADMIRQADRSSNIAGTILLFDTPGGTTNAVIQLEDALRNRVKPCLALIDGLCDSAGLYAASLCDEIYAVNRMCEAGSIGTYARIIDTGEAEKKWGYRIEYIYPPESKFKNLPVREALEGKPERLIREMLTPYAIHFQNIIRENRPRMDTSVEGILEGRVFYAYEAIENGLIDGLMNLNQAIDRVRLLAEQKKSFYSQLNI